MKIINGPFIYFHNRWWTFPRAHVGPTALFFPEDKKVFCLSELKAIVSEMEKMNDIRPK